MQAVLMDGVVAGVQLGLLAAGLTLLYGLGGVLNLAHGATAVAAAMAMWAAGGAGVRAFPAVLLGIAAAALIGLLMDRTILQPVYRRTGEEGVLLGLLLTLGAAFLIDGVLGWRYPNAALSLRIGGGPVEVAGVAMRRGSLIAVGIAAVALGLTTAGLRWTRFGRAVRAVIQDETGARLVGISPARVRSTIAVGGAALAGLYAATHAMTAPVVVTDGFALTTSALIVTVVGGLGSPSGALQAGVLLGVVNTVSATYIGTYTTSLILLAAAALTIVLRPSGLAGRTS